jgi:drug/metabolite transporter (DMT)-like permease
VGAVPVLVALMAAARGDGTGRARNWIGYGLTLAGVGLIAHTGASGASPTGDLLVVISVVLSAAFIVVQPRLLAERDAAAVTAVQFAAAALVALPVAVLTESGPSAPAHVGLMLALIALASVGTLLPFWLFAFGQARVPADVAGAFVNLEPVVGALAGWLAFGDTATVAQLMGALAVLGGIGLSTARRQPSPTPAIADESAGPARHSRGSSVVGRVGQSRAMSRAFRHSQINTPGIVRRRARSAARASVSCD